MRYVISKTGILTAVEKENGDDDRLEIPEGVKKIKRLYGTGFRIVTIPTSVIEISDMAFFNWTQLECVIFNENSHLKKIGDDAFSKCTKLQYIHLPDSLTEVGEYAFAECGVLLDVKIGKNLETISKCCFSYCIGLQKVTFAENSKLNKIGIEAFLNCSMLKKIELPENLLEIGAFAFQNCINLQAISLHDRIFIIGKGAFHSTAYMNNKSNWTKDDCVLYIGPYLISCKKSSASAIFVKKGTKIIAANAFEFCSKITTVILPDGLVDINDYAFCECSSLEGIALPDSVMFVGCSAFVNCESLTYAIIPHKVEYIGENAFQGCKKLEIVQCDNPKFIVKSVFDYSSVEIISIIVNELFDFEKTSSEIEALIKDCQKTVKYIYLEKSNIFPDDFNVLPLYQEKFEW